MGRLHLRRVMSDIKCCVWASAEAAKWTVRRLLGCLGLFLNWHCIYGFDIFDFFYMFILGSRNIYRAFTVFSQHSIKDNNRRGWEILGHAVLCFRLSTEWAHHWLWLPAVTEGHPQTSRWSWTLAKGQFHYITPYFISFLVFCYITSHFSTPYYDHVPMNLCASVHDVHDNRFLFFIFYLSLTFNSS